MSIKSYTEYHNDMMKARDVDPSIICLDYIANRFELNMEQRYWIAFLYGTCYCAPTVFFMYNEFPDYQNVDLHRLQNWWTNNRPHLKFQTDRLRIKSNNQFVKSFISYKQLVQNNQQNLFFNGIKDDKQYNYQLTYQKALKIAYFGRFSLFNYLDTLNRITNLKCEPHTLDLSQAKSCRNGLAYAIGRTDLMNHHSKKKLTKKEINTLQREFLSIKTKHQGDIFQIETTLCAYKKYRLGKRYVGYYIDRLGKEIEHYKHIKGVDWSVLWDFRAETFQNKYLYEYN